MGHFRVEQKRNVQKPKTTASLGYRNVHQETANFLRLIHVAIGNMGFD